MATVKLTSRTRIPSAHATKYLGSKVTSGARVFVEGGDAKSRWSRRWKDLILAHVADLGGVEDLSEAQISLIRRASAVEIELEAMEARRSEGQKIDVELYSRLISLLCRTFELIGVRRRSAPIDPLNELTAALEAYPVPPIDEDDDEDEDDAPIEFGLDREPGEA